MRILESEAVIAREFCRKTPQYNEWFIQVERGVVMLANVSNPSILLR